MEDRRLVQLALAHRMVSEAQIADVTREQRALADRGIERSIWFLLMDLGHISDAQARELRKHISSSAIRALEIDGYVLQGRIGSGGMGDVFRARNAEGEEAAVKLLSAKIGADGENAKRFVREARAGLRLVHPHITRSLRSGESDGQRYLIMELVTGQSLKQRIAEGGRMAENDALVLIWQIASALAYAWSHGVLHRDIKPANLMLSHPRPGVTEPFCAKVCDFGLAKVYRQGPEDQESTGQLTGTGLALGTPHFMPPEQASGEQDLDQRADIYSLGASVYNALLSRTMHMGKSSTVIMYKQVTESVDLKPLGELGISAGTVKLLQRMLERHRRLRFPDWNDVQNAVRRLAPEMAARQAAALATAGVGLLPGSSSSTMPATQLLTPPTRPATKAIPVHARVPAAPSATARISVHQAPTPGHHPGTTSGAASAAAVVAMAPQRGSARGVAWAVAAACVLITALAGLFLLLSRSASAHVTPATFANALAAARALGRGELILDPGDYTGPWRFGVADSGLRVRGTGAGVRLIAPPRHDEEALIQLEPGLHDFRLTGVTLASGPETSIEALGGAEATVQDLVLPGALVISGAQILASGLRVEGGTRLEAHGHLVLEDSCLRGATPLDLHDGQALLHCCSLRVTPGAGDDVQAAAGGAAGPPAAVVRVLAGTLTLDVVTVEGRAGAVATSTGIDLSASATCLLTDVAVSRVRVGVHGAGAQLEQIDGLSVDAAATAMVWEGEPPAAGHWQRLALHAPQLVQGDLHLPVDGGKGGGARAERLALIPAKDGLRR